jgi:hypothetical protein
LNEAGPYSNRLRRVEANLTTRRIRARRDLLGEFARRVLAAKQPFVRFHEFGTFAL